MINSVTTLSVYIYIYYCLTLIMHILDLGYFVLHRIPFINDVAEPLVLGLQSNTNDLLNNAATTFS